MDNWTTPAEAVALLRELFPEGLVSTGVLHSLCPEGWLQSPLRAAFHPPPRDLYEETLRMRENLRAVFGRSNKKELPPEEPPPSFEEFVADLVPPECVPDEEEAGRLTGLCLWDIFSDNHDVIVPDRRSAHLGSFRGSAGEIAGFFYNKPPEEPPDFARFKSETDFMDYLKANMDYMEFYMGSRMISHRTSLRPGFGGSEVPPAAGNRARLSRSLWTLSLRLAAVGGRGITIARGPGLKRNRKMLFGGY